MFKFSSIKQADGMLLNKTLTTHFYINCQNISIHLALFYERGDFYWIGEANKQHGASKWFGDTPRGINQYA